MSRTLTPVVPLQLSGNGLITAVGSESTDILWPFSSNQVNVNLVISGSTQNIQPSFVSLAHHRAHHARMRPSACLLLSFAQHVNMK